MGTVPPANGLQQRLERFENGLGQLEEKYFTVGKHFYAIPEHILDPILSAWEEDDPDTMLSNAFMPVKESPDGAMFAQTLNAIRKIREDIKKALQDGNLASAEQELTFGEGIGNRLDTCLTYVVEEVDELYIKALGAPRDPSGDPVGLDLRNVAPHVHQLFEAWISWLPWNLWAYDSEETPAVARLTYEAINEEMSKFLKGDDDEEMIDAAIPVADSNPTADAPVTDGTADGAQEGFKNFLDAYLSDEGADLAIRLKQVGVKSGEGGDDPAGTLLQGR